MPSFILQTVKDIMKKKVITIDPKSSLRKAAKTMEKKGIGSLIVIKDKQLVGIITERDFTKAVANGLNPDKTCVEDIMSKPVLTCAPDVSIVSLVSLMKTEGKRHIPIVKERELLGIVSNRDLIGIELQNLALFFHSLLFGYYKALGDMFKVGCLVLAPYVVDNIIDLCKRYGMELATAKSLEENLENMKRSLIEAGLINDMKVIEEKRNVYCVEVRDCRFAKFAHALLVPAEIICPIAIFTACILRKATERKVKLTASELIPSGTKTYITLT